MADNKEITSTTILLNSREGSSKTHHSMGSMKYSYQLNRDTLTDIYNDDNLDPLIGLVEKPQHYSMLRFDLDFLSENINCDNEFDLESITKNTLFIIREYLNKNLLNPTPRKLDCCILTKPSYINDKGKRKYGIHGQFPRLFISTPDFMNFENEMKSKISGFDKIAKNGWLLYGQQKSQISGSYKLAYIDVEGKKISPKNYFTKYKIYDKYEKQITFTLPLEHYYKQFFSILPLNRKTDDFIPFIDEKITKIEKNYSSHKKEFEPEDDTDNVDINDVKKLVDMLSISRADNTQEWFLLCWCLNGIGHASDEYLDIFKNFSSKSDKYDEDSCIDYWNNTKKNELKIGTLHYWAKYDNYEEYKKFIMTSKNTQGRILDSLCGSHYDLAKLFMLIYGKDNIKITSDHDLSFFGWNEECKLWEESSKHKLSKIVSESLFPIFLKAGKECCTAIDNCAKGDKIQETLLNARLKQISKMNSNLKSTPFLKNVCLQIAGYDFDNDFESKVINKSIYELPIKGCKVINLKTLEVRDRTRNDFFSFELKVDFRGIDYDFEKHVLPFFRGITCNSPKLIDYHRRLWGYMMTGSISDRSLHIIWGNGLNGKTSLVNIFKNIMGDFAVSLDEDTMMKKSSSGAKPEMMDLLHSRCGILPESDKKESINSKRVKTITGDDEISARHLFGHITKFKTQCKPVFPTNFKPEIDIDDKAILDRLKLIPFLANFEKNIVNKAYITDLQENRLDDFFTWFCIGARDWINGDELIPCSEMNDQMDIYIKENNPIIDFLEETFDLIPKEDYDKLDKEEKCLWRYKKTDMFPQYGCWRQLNGEKSMSKLEFNNLIEKRVVEIKDSKGTRCYLCRIKHLEQQCEGLPPM